MLSFLGTDGYHSTDKRESFFVKNTVVWQQKVQGER